MAKLQKSDRQQRHRSRPPVCTDGEHSASSTSPTSTNQKDRATSCPPPQRNQMSLAMEPPQIGAQSRSEDVVVKSFEHSPTAPEGSFVAVGREMFLRRASIISQTYANKFRGNDGNMAATPTDASNKINNSAASSRKLDRSGGTAHRDPPSSFRGFPDLTPKGPARPKSLVPKSRAGPTPSEKPDPMPVKTSMVRFVSRKRSQSLPPMKKSEAMQSTFSRLTSTSEKEAQPKSSQSSISEKDRLPFTPKVDLEVVFDNISAVYNQKLAEAQRKSSILWKKTFVDQRTANREAGVLKKRQRRVSSPAAPGRPLAVPYDIVKPAGQPQLVDSLKAELPSSKGIALDQGYEKTSSSYRDTQTPRLSLADMSIRTRSKKNLSIDSVLANSDEAADHTPCPHCGHKSESDDHTMPETQSSPDLKTMHLMSRKSDNVVPLQMSYPGPQSKVSRKPPTTPTEISVTERMQATRAIIEAASKDHKLGKPPKAASDRHSSQPPPHLLPSSESRGSLARSRPSYLPESLSGTSHGRTTQLSGTTAATKGSATASYVSSAGQLLARPDIEADRERQPRVSSDHSEQISITRRQSEDSAQQAHWFSPKHSPASSVSSFYSFASSQSQTPSLNQTNCTSAPASQSKLSFILAGSTENVVRSPRTSSASPSRGVLSISPSIVSRTLITDIHPALRDEYVMALDGSTTTSFPLAESLTVTHGPELLPYALNISRSSKRSSSTTIVQEKGEDQHKPTALAARQLPPIPKQIQSRFTELELKPREGPQSLSQFQRNCRQVPLSPTAPESASPPIPSVENNEDPTPALRRKAHLKNETSARNKLQKVRPDPETENNGRGRRRDRHSQALVSQRISSLQATTSVPTKEAKPSFEVGLGLNVVHASARASPSSTVPEPDRAVDTKKSKISVPPNSYVSQAQNRHEDRSTSRGRSRLRSLLSSVRFSSREARADERVDSSRPETTESESHDHPGKAVDTFQTSGPYEQIVSPVMTATSSRSARRRKKESDAT